MSTWHEVADDLAERLRHQAALCGQARGDYTDDALGCPHDPATSYRTEGECPFCADHAAWARWNRKAERAKGLARRRRIAAAGVGGADQPA